MKCMKLAAAAVAAAHLAACTTVGHSRNPGEPPLTVRTGDRVHLYGPNAQGGLEVTNVNGDQVCTTEGCFSRDDVSNLYREEVDQSRTTKTVLVVVALIAAIALIAALHGAGGAAYGFPAMLP